MNTFMLFLFGFAVTGLLALGCLEQNNGKQAPRFCYMGAIFIIVAYCVIFGSTLLIIEIFF